MLRNIFLLVSVASLVSCGSQGGSTGSGAKKPAQPGSASPEAAVRINSAALHLLNGMRSPDELIGSALAAFAVNDTAGLERLLVTREEFDSIIYPELGIHYPAARDMRPETRTFLWENQMMNSSQGLRRAIRDLAGEKMKLLSVSYTEGGKKYNSYSIYEGTTVRVEMPDGRQADIHAFGSVVEMDGVYKLLTYRQR